MLLALLAPRRSRHNPAAPHTWPVHRQSAVELHTGSQRSTAERAGTENGAGGSDGGAGGSGASAACFRVRAAAAGRAPFVSTSASVSQGRNNSTAEEVEKQLKEGGEREAETLPLGNEGPIIGPDVMKGWRV